MDWQNRPTFQQADEILSHRPFPSRPACIYNLQLAASVAKIFRPSRSVRIR